MDKEVIKQLRSQLNMTQADLASKIGVTVSTVARWETGVYKPSKLAVTQLNKLLKKVT